MKSLLAFTFCLISLMTANAQNTPPIVSGDTEIGNHFHAGQGNELWSDATSLYVNYRGNAAATYFCGNSTGKPIMTLLNSGYVGIGASIPNSLLHINSAVERNTFRIYKNGNTTNYVSIWQGSSAAAIDPIGTGVLYLGYDQATNVIMGITGAGANSGFVGIGTPSPDAKLTVKGQIHAQEVKIDLNGTIAPPDYVFEKDYQLASLKEIKTYIDQNKHLPEVPSAKEILNNGVQLGEMNMLLLKKIEELTLHMIELQEDNLNLSKRLEIIENHK